MYRHSDYVYMKSNTSKDFQLQFWSGVVKTLLSRSPLNHFDLISVHSISICSCYILLIAGAIPPTDPGPGIFPATAAA